MGDSRFVRIPTPRIAVMPGDLHIPRHDAQAVLLMEAVTRSVSSLLGVGRQGRSLLLPGDVFDSSQFSPHPGARKDGRGGDLEAEISAARPMFRRWRKLFGAIDVIAGNHEAWQDGCDALASSPWWRVYGDLMDGCRVHSEGTSLLLGKLVVCHGHDLRGSLSKHSTATVLSNYSGQNTIYGHTHRMGACTTPVYKNGLPVVHGSYNVGHMADVRHERASRFMRTNAEAHQQGFGLIHFRRGIFNVELCPIYRDQTHMWTWALGRIFRRRTDAVRS